MTDNLQLDLSIIFTKIYCKHILTYKIHEGDHISSNAKLLSFLFLHLGTLQRRIRFRLILLEYNAISSHFSLVFQASLPNDASRCHRNCLLRQSEPLQSHDNVLLMIPPCERPDNADCSLGYHLFERQTKISRRKIFLPFAFSLPSSLTASVCSCGSV